MNRLARALVSALSLLPVLFSVPLSAQTYANVDDKTSPWGTCNLCAGGTGVSTGVSQTFNNASPSLDGGSMLLSMTGQAGLPAGQTTNQIWYYKPEATGSVDTFIGTYNVYLNSVSNIQALEYDQFQFNVGHRFMMGSECDIGAFWKIWNQLTSTWITTTAPCQIVAGQWFKIVWNTHRDPLTSTACSGQPCMYYDKLTVTTNGVTSTYGPFASQPSNTSSDTDDIGINIQIDVNITGGAASEYVDETSLQVAVSRVAALNSSQTKVYVVFPPESGPANTHFTQYVMPQLAIAGVTDQFVWSSVETTTDPTTQGSCSPSDQCQQDSVGKWHTYNWSSVDSTLAQWFDTTQPWGKKQVNVMSVGQTDGLNKGTPHYVTTSSWATAVGATQHYINDTKDSCSNYYGPTITSASRTSNVVTVYEPAHGYVTGDIVWIEGFTDNSFNVTTQAGVSIIVTDSSYWTYPSTGSDGSASGTGHAISQTQSWFLPSDATYSVAYYAFVAAAVAHFNGSTSLSQIGYFRPGYARGGEAVMLCPDQLVAQLVPGYTSQAQAKTTWLASYANLYSYVSTLNPKFQITVPLNPGWTTAAPDYTYGDAQAASAIADVNANGFRDGFGSQGLQQSDIASKIPPPPYSAADWVNVANNYGQTGLISPGTQPIEGQQIDCSDPTAIWKGTSWVSGLENVSCFQLGSAPTNKSKTGDLRVLLPYAKSKGLNFLELYNIDALLAFDPTYCVLSGASCGTGSVPAAVYGMRCVGPTTFADTNCPNGVGGDGTYAAALNSFANYGSQVGCLVQPCPAGRFEIETPSEVDGAEWWWILLDHL